MPMPSIMLFVKMSMQSKQLSGKGFTIVELLIVIVVIAILAAITIVAYNGIQQRAQSSAVESAISQAVRKIELYKVDHNGAYPPTPADAGITASGDLGIAYSAASGGYCVSYVRNATSYVATNADTKPRSGGCATDNGLVAEWLFNGNANDTSGSGMNGTVNGATLSAGRSGQTNTAYAFSGATQYISLASSVPINFTNGQFSVSTWVNISTLPAAATWYDILSSTGTGDWSFGINATAAGVGRAMMTKVSQTDSPAGPTVEQNSWKMLTAVYTYGPSPSTVEYYIDGVSTGSVNWNHSTQGSFTPVTKRIGSRASSGYFRGAIDELRVYNRALTAAEITSLFAAGPQ
jgi:prepilin-type N-terminal cleavage/methylation domain-containing protein